MQFHLFVGRFGKRISAGRKIGPNFFPVLISRNVSFFNFLHVLFIIFLISTVVIIYHFTIYLLCCLLTLNKCTTRQKFLASIYLVKVNNGKTRTKCEICSKLTVRRYSSFWCLCCKL